MSARQFAPSVYLVSAFTIAVAVTFGSGPEAQAQDLNLQSQINILSPPLEATRATPNITPEVSQAAALKCSPNEEQINKAVDAILKAPPNKTATFGGDSSSEAKLDQELSAHASNLKEYLSENSDTACKVINRLVRQRRLNRKLAAPYFPVNLSAKTRQDTTVKVSFPFNPTYETDVLKTGTNSSHGASAGFGGNVLVTTGVEGRQFDLVALSAGTASSRYSPYSSASLDAVTSQLVYQAFLNADGYFVHPDGHSDFVKDVDKNPTMVPAAGMITIETLAFGFQNQTAYTPTFHSEKADLFTPQVTFSRQNMDLSGFGAACSTLYNPPRKPDAPPNAPPANQGFCYYADFSITGGQTLSDVSKQQNGNLAASLNLGTRIPGTDLKFAIQSTATGRIYETFVGGRRDVLLQSGPVISYTPIPTVTFTLPVTFYRNYSSVAAAAWTGLIIQPTLTIAFSYTNH